MIQSKSKLFVEVANAFQAVVESKDPKRIDEVAQVISKTKHYDPLLLLNTDVGRKLFPIQYDGKTLAVEDWLRSLKQWRKSYLRPRTKTYAEDVLYKLWDQYQLKLTSRLERAMELQVIPRQGGILAFVEGLAKCIVIEYEFSGRSVDLDPIEIIPEPRSIFDFWATINNVKPAAQNALKQILASGHKIIYHRGTLVHVDRRAENTVFGPTIDTVLLGEILVQYILENRSNGIRSALEVGSGSGLLSAILLVNNPNLEELFAIDVDFASAACTQKNCVLGQEPRTTPAKTWFVGGNFVPGGWHKLVDLCVCNPPYIPVPSSPGTGVTDKFLSNRRATGGTELMELLISKIGSVVKPTGTLALITSNLSLPIVEKHLPHDFEIEKPLGDGGFKVIFDVDSVLADKEWLEFLQQNHGLEKDRDTFYHYLHPLLITKSSYE